MLFNGGEKDDWHLDINIQNGTFQLMEEPALPHTRSQRKAVLAHQMLGTIPGDWNRGIDWTRIINTANMIPMAEAMMEVQAAIEEDEGESAMGSFSVPIIGVDGEAADIQLLTVSPDDLKGIKYA